jgi:hypothetical protein
VASPGRALCSSSERRCARPPSSASRGSQAGRGCFIMQGDFSTERPRCADLGNAIGATEWRSGRLAKSYCLGHEFD